jgi:hypothetical protein
MGFIQKEVLSALEETGRDNWTSRQMTRLTSEGLLPKLIRTTQPGTNKPLYVWEETDLDQIVTIYDLLEYYGGSHEAVSLVLWLEGYGISLDLLRRTFLRPIENYLQRLTQGETDPDEIAFSVSSIALMLLNKLQFTPGLTTQRKKINKEQMSLFTQILLDILSDQEPDAKMLRSLFIENTDALSNPAEQIDDEFFERTQRGVEIMRDILALPRLREAIRTATPEQWQQVRKDYLSFCHMLRVIENRRTNAGGETLALPEEFLMGLKITGARWLTAPLLSARCRGYGQWIDAGFEKIHEFLADPEVQERILTRAKARGIIEDVQDSEKPDLLISE